MRKNKSLFFLIIRNFNITNFKLNYKYIQPFFTTTINIKIVTKFEWAFQPSLQFKKMLELQIS